MPDVDTIGARLRRLRRERGITQDELAEASGVSRDLIAKLEQERRTSARVTSLTRLANALDVPLSELLDKRDRIGPDRDGGSILAIRDALLSPTLLPGPPGRPGPGPADEPTPLPDIRTAVTRAWDHYWNGRFGPLTATLPALITEARRTPLALGPTAAQPLAQAYQLAACLMVHLGKDDLAAIAAERAIAAAHTGDDPLQWASCQGTYSWVLLHQARLSEAEQHALRVAGEIEPSISTDSQGHLTVWGGLLLTAMAPAAVAGRADSVKDHLGLARAAAARLERDRLDYNINFGPTQVAMQATYAHSVLKQPDRALRSARAVRRRDLRSISYGAHLLDVAQAQADSRHPREAVHTLQAAQTIAPVWFRHQGIARSLVRDIRETETRLTPAIRSLARSLDV